MRENPPPTDHVLIPLSSTSSEFRNQQQSKGLRNLSLKVKQIVEDKQETTYKQVADILVEELRALQTDQADLIEFVIILPFRERLAHGGAIGYEKILIRLSLTAEKLAI